MDCLRDLNEGFYCELSVPRNSRCLQFMLLWSVYEMSNGCVVLSLEIDLIATCFKEHPVLLVLSAEMTAVPPTYLHLYFLLLLLFWCWCWCWCCCWCRPKSCALWTHARTWMFYNIHYHCHLLQVSGFSWSFFAHYSRSGSNVWSCQMVVKVQCDDGEIYRLTLQEEQTS